MRSFSFPAEGDSFLLDADPELREELPARIERYIIADDVQIEDVTDRFAIFHVTVRRSHLQFRRREPCGRLDSGAQVGIFGSRAAERDRAFQQLSSSLCFLR